jgi:hypothetical protein
MTVQELHKLQSYSTADLTGGKPVWITLAILAAFMIGVFFGKSFDFNAKTDKPAAATAHGRFGTFHEADALPPPSP